MKYDFDIVTERRGSGCVKWDSNNRQVDIQKVTLTPPMAVKPGIS